MKYFIQTIIILFWASSILAQTDYDKQVEFFANDILQKLPLTSKKIAVIDFKNNDEETTQLTRLVAEDISAELAVLSSGQSKFEIVERNNLKDILADLKLSTSKDESKIARELGKKAIADVLLTGTITLFGDNYRISIKALNTETGNVITASKGLVVKTSALEDLHKKVIEKNNSNVSSNRVMPEISPMPIKESSVPKSENGWIDFDNNTSDLITVFLSTDREVQNLKATKYEQFTIASRSSEKMPALVPGIYYVCALTGMDLTCRFTKKVEVKSAAGSHCTFSY